MAVGDWLVAQVLISFLLRYRSEDLRLHLHQLFHRCIGRLQKNTAPEVGER